MAQQRSSKPAHDPHAATIQVGYWVALTLRPNAAPMRCYVGRVEAVDDRGVRLTQVDWILGMATEWDFFATWDQITTMLIATPDHDTKMFGESAGNWQTRMNDIGHATPLLTLETSPETS